MDERRVMEQIRIATLEVFSIMLGMKLTPGESYVLPRAPAPKAGVVSFIGLAGNWVGMGSIVCSPGFACQAANALLMAEYTAINEEVLDATAEITNMVIGSMKTALEAEVGVMGLSIPTVIYGWNFVTRMMSSHEWIIAPFLYGGESFEVHLCLAPKSGIDVLSRASLAEQHREVPTRL